MPDATIHAAKNKQPQFSTQLYLRIAEIHDDVVVLKNGGVRAVLSVGSVNINLKSEDEQNALVYSYQNFLNALEFPVQIVVRSKKLDVSGYLEKLDDVRMHQRNELMKRQVAEYTDYIRRLVDVADIMQKEFYVIVPYDPYRAQNSNMLEKFWDFIHPADSETAFRQRRKEFQTLVKPLGQRVDTVRAGLESCALPARQLTTKELIALFYDVYNPLTARTQKIDDITKTNLVIDTATAAITA